MEVRTHLAELGLVPLGIVNAQAIYHNLSYNDLFNHETHDALPDTIKGKVTQLGAVAIDTGRYTGRSPKDKYIVKDTETEHKVWWHDQGSDNKPIDNEVWATLKRNALKQLNGKTLYVMDGFCGANPKTRLAVRLVTELSWMAHFFKNMFIRPTEAELSNFEPEWTIFNACKAQYDQYQKLGLNSSTYVAFNLTEKMTLIGGTWYGGEIKKGIFSIMNYFLPLQGIGSFHCSANEGKAGDTALFFGLSGTGKTTLSADPKRALIGDDEHGWDDDGIFNLEGGCYAKTIKLSKAQEPDIYRAIRRDALLENIVMDGQGRINFDDDSKTENTRVSYPIYHIDNIVKPISKGGHPKRIIFLTCDAYGVLPPVSILSKEQAMYQYLSGYTAKVAGTELGIEEPTACFSACFGQPFLLLHPTIYAKILGEKIAQHGSHAFLVNTGWTGGAYGVGHRISIQDTRAIIDAIVDGQIDQAETEVVPIFNLTIPTSLPGVDPHILNPKNTWQDQHAYDQAAQHLAQSFVDNFTRFTSESLAQRLTKFGPVRCQLTKCEKA